EDVPLPELVDLVVELDAARSLRDHVDLLLTGVRVAERQGGAGRELLDADAAGPAVELALREADVHALRHLEPGGNVLHVAEVDDRVVAHAREASAAHRTGPTYAGPVRILLVSQMYPGPDAPDLGTFVAQ